MQETRNKKQAPLNFNLFGSLHLTSCLFFLSCLLFLSQSHAWAVGEVMIEQVQVREKAPQRFEIQANVINTTKEAREVTLRAQVEVFDRMVPRGDQPLNVFRRDRNLILKPGETRPLRFQFVGEGVPPKTATRVEPTVRIRRQRVWNY